MRRIVRRLVVPLAAVAVIGVAVPVIAQQWDAVQITATDLGGGVHMLQGRGGNLAVLVGDEGVILVDDQFAPLSGKIRAAIGEISDKPIKFVMNTHWHGDHTGGNENFGKAGAVIVAHDNVRERMSTEQVNKLFGRKTPPSPAAALPVVTFPESVKLHLNGETVHATHVDPAHTDGDAFIRFVKADVIHMGDLFFNGRYPFIDLSSNGSIHGVIAAAEEVLAVAGDETKIVPGHGDLATKKDLATYRDVLVKVRDAVQAMIDAGKTRDEVLAAKVGGEWDATWGTGFMKPDIFVGIVFDSLQR